MMRNIPSVFAQFSLCLPPGVSIGRRVTICPHPSERAESLSHFFDVYRNNLKNREFGKKAPQNFDSERATIARGCGHLCEEHGCSSHKGNRTLKNSPWDCFSGKQVNEVNGHEGGASENQNSEAKPTPPKTDSSGCFGISRGRL